MKCWAVSIFGVKGIGSVDSVGFAHSIAAAIKAETKQDAESECIRSFKEDYPDYDIKSVATAEVCIKFNGIPIVY